MRQRQTLQWHLTVEEISVLPGREWRPTARGWLFLQVTDGAAYWLGENGARELPGGSALLLSPETGGCLRASQLGSVGARFFSVEPAALIGLMNVAEQEFFRRAAEQEEFSVRILPADDPISARFLRVCERERERDDGFAARMSRLQLFVDLFTDDLKRLKTRPTAGSDARERLMEVLGRTPAAGLLDLSFSDLVRQANCTPRHLSRIFREALGVSFRQKQAEIRLARARELLATTGYKVVDVALESGYQSLSLFNLMFKRRFGVSPGQWREQFKARRTARRNGARLTTLQL